MIIRLYNTIAIIFSCQNNYFLISDAPLFIVIAFNVALFDVALFDDKLI